MFLYFYMSTTKQDIMKQLYALLLLLVGFSVNPLYAQLPNGATAPDWTLTDIEGNSHHLYEYLDQGKMVIIEFSATWCGPCWNYMLSGALETIWEEHGPNGDNTVMIFYIEADQSTDMDDLLGLTPESQGNWVEAIPFPIIDLQAGQNVDNQYQIAYYPTLYATCSDRLIYEAGQIPATAWATWIQSCSLEAELDAIEDAICGSDGSASVHAEGGYSNINYQWSNGAHSQTIQNISGGNYEVTVSDGNNRSIVVENIVVGGPDAPLEISSSSSTNTLCFGDETGTLTVSGGEGTAPYEYSWSNGDDTPEIENLGAGNYTVTITDDNGCTVEETYEVEEPEELESEVEVSPEYCQQENGSIVITNIQGGVGNYDITSSSGNVFGDEIVNLVAGEVIVTIEDANGCILETTYEVEEGEEPSVFFSSQNEITCTQPILTISGFVASGSGDYTYNWSTVNGVIVGATNDDQVQISASGTYELEIYDLFTECQVAATFEVVEDIDVPVVFAGNDIEYNCENQQFNLQGEGDPSYQVSWATVEGNIVEGANTYTPTVNAPGFYTITVVNPLNNCSNTDDVYVPNNADPAQALFNYQTSSLTLVGTSISTGSNLGNYLWTFGDGNSSTDPNTIHNYATEGTYTVCLSVSNGCGVSETCQNVEVIFSGSVLQVEGGVINVDCHGNATGAVNLVVNGGSGVYTFLWTGPQGESYNTEDIGGLVAGPYIVLVTDDQGNSFTNIYTVGQPDPITLEGSAIVDNLCHGQAQGSITVQVIGGVGPFLYGFNNEPPVAENTFSNLPAGSYSVVVIDNNNCPFDAGTFTISDPELLDYTVTEVLNADNLEQNNGSITIVPSGGVQPYTVVWSNGATGTTINNLTPGSYSWTLTDANGCVKESVNPVEILGESVSVKDVTWSNNISVNPNPSNGSSIIKWENLPSGNGTIQLNTIEGRTIGSRDIDGLTGQWNLGETKLTAGLYVITFKVDRDVVTMKLIVL